MTSGKRVAVVTGGASGLGAAICERLAREGAHVVIADIDAAGAEGVRARIAAAGGDASVQVADVTKASDVERLMQAAEGRGRLYALILSAAIEVRRDLTATADDEWQRVLDVDLKGPFLCMRQGIPRMVRGGGGAVVALGSTLGAIGQPGYAAYCAAKGALVNLCKQAAIEHAREGVRVNVVSPAACDTGLFVRVAAQTGNAAAVMESVARNMPAGRLGTAEDVVATVSFLVSDGASYISGTVIPLDGGLAARRQ